MYNRYNAATGSVRRVYETQPQQSPQQAPPPPRPIPAPGPGFMRPPSPLHGLSGELGRLLQRLSPLSLETDDLLLMLVLYLMYRESRDDELLLIMAAMLFL